MDQVRERNRRTPEGPASWQGYMVTWIPFHGRSAALARQLGLTPLWAPRWSRRTPVVVRYAAATARTLRILGRSPHPVIVTLPPLPALVVVLMSRRRRRAPLLADMHSGAFLDPRWRRFLAPTLYLLRRDAAIVTNANLATVCRRAGVQTFVLDDPLEPAEAPAGPATDDPYVLVVLSYASDEPVPEILEAASRRADRRFVCTGAAPEAIRRSAPRNVSFSGFVPRDAFIRLLRGSRAVVALTTQPDTMQRAAYEALEHGVPVVTSDTQVLRDYFGDAAVYARATATSIDAAIEEALRRNRDLRASLLTLQSRRLSDQQRALREVASYLRRR
jgi:glycosyltransferase involved in cell wall biosynthesis